MLISPPFLTSTEPSEDNEDSVEHAFTGHYPVTSYLDWHNGLHLIAPQENGYVDARAIADGKVIYVRPADDKPSTDPEHAQNYAAYGGSKEWSDRGMVILEHQTEIGAKGDTPTVIVFYSVYAHLKSIQKITVPKQGGKKGETEARALQKEDKVYRKDLLGKPGQIYGYRGHMHFEICMDDANLQKLLGQDPMAWPNADARPTKDGRTDAVFGRMYIYVPSNAAAYHTEDRPIAYGRPFEVPNALPAAQWVELDYSQAGDVVLRSYDTIGRPIGTAITETGGEYKLYETATHLHDNLPNDYKMHSSPSAWYELLRFGRNLGSDPLPHRAPHWRKVPTPLGARWVNLNQDTFKFSDADFPAFMGWTCIADDKDIDQFCNSVKLKNLLTQHITDPDEREAVLKDVKKMGRLAQTQAKTRLRRAICKYPTEFDQSDIDQRYGYIQQEKYFQETEGAWGKLRAHIAAMTCDDLPEEYKNAQWHFHPLEFINVMKKCGWLSKEELSRSLPQASLNNVMRFQFALNFIGRKYLGEQKTRLWHFLGQVAHETSSLAGPMVESRNSNASRQYETETSYFTGPDTYAPFQAGEGYEKLHNTLGNQFRSGDGIKYRGRGSLQVTGRANYANYWLYRGWLASNSFTASWWSKNGWWSTSPPIDLIAAPIANPQRVSARCVGNELNPIDIGGWFWISNKINKKCDSESLRSSIATNSMDVSLIINRYDTTTFPFRKTHSEMAKKIIGDAV